MDTLNAAIGGMAGEVGGIMLVVCAVATIFVVTDPELRARRARNRTARDLRSLRRHESTMEALGRKADR